MKRGGYVYIMVNTRHTVFYVGVTANLAMRVTQHQEKVNPKSFTARYSLNKIVYYEPFASIEEAIEREKQLKKYSRTEKVALINSINPQWKDLSEEIRRW